MFERFWRVRGGRGKAGSGIGLAIVAELAHVHGGPAEVVTTPGHGSSFRVLLPRAGDDPSPAADVALGGGGASGGLRGPG